MSIRLSEKYQKFKQKNGTHSYRIYNLEIFSSLQIQYELLTQDQEELSQKYEKRCQFRELSFVEPQIHFYPVQSHRQHRNLKYDDHNNDEEENSQNGIMHMNSQNLQTRMQKQSNLCFDGQRKLSNMSKSQLEYNNSEQNSPQYVLKSISYDKNHKQQQQQQHQTHQMFIPYIPGLHVNQAASTQIMISSQKCMQNPEQKSFLKISPTEQQFNINQKTLSQHTNFNLQNNYTLNSNQYPSGCYIQHGNVQQLDDIQNENVNFMIKKDESEYLNHDDDLQDNYEDFKRSKTKLTNHRNGIIQNQMANNCLNLNTNTNLVMNKMDFNNSKQNQNQQIRQHKQDNLLITNKKFVGKEKQIYTSDGYKSQISHDISVVKKEKENSPHLYENNGSINNDQNQNNSPVSNVNMSEVHNSELFKSISLEYKQIPKNNTLKNIKKAFIRYLLKTNRKQLTKKCEQFNLNPSYILTALCQEIKYDHRHNKNIRFLLKSEQISPLFKDFLENSEDYWFSHSSLLNTEPCRQMVNLLLKLTQNVLLIDVIQEYEK